MTPTPPGAPLRGRGARRSRRRPRGTSPRQPARVGVVAAAVIAVEQRDAARQLVPRAVRERAAPSASCRAPTASRRARCGRARGSRRPRARAARSAREIAVAVADLGRRRLVVRRQAFHRVGDPAVDEREAVVARGRDRLRREAVRVQRLVQQDSRVVAGERPAARVGAVHARREPDDHERGVARRRTAAPAGRSSRDSPRARDRGTPRAARSGGSRRRRPAPRRILAECRRASRWPKPITTGGRRSPPGRDSLPKRSPRHAPRRVEPRSPHLPAGARQRQRRASRRCCSSTAAIATRGAGRRTSCRGSRRRATPRTRCRCAATARPAAARRCS